MEEEDFSARRYNVQWRHSTATKPYSVLTHAQLLAAVDTDYSNDIITLHKIRHIKVGETKSLVLKDTSDTSGLGSTCFHYVTRLPDEPAPSTHVSENET